MRKLVLVVLAAATVILTTSAIGHDAIGHDDSVSHHIDGNEIDIWAAVARGEFKTVEQLLNDGVSVDIRQDLINSTPLIVATLFNQPDIVKLLLDRDATVDARDAYGNTSLLVASYLGYESIFDTLEKAGADITLTNNLGQDSRSMLQISWQVTNEMTNKVYSLGLTEEEVLTGRKKIEELLVEAYLELAKKDIWTAVVLGEADLVQQHLEAGAKPDFMKTDEGAPILLVATACNVPEVVQTLIQGGADVDITDHQGTPALYVAIMFGFAEVARVLIDAGADQSISTHHGGTIENFFDMDWSTTSYVARLTKVDVEESSVAEGRKEIRRIIDQSSSKD